MDEYKQTPYLKFSDPNELNALETGSSRDKSNNKCK